MLQLNLLNQGSRNTSGCVSNTEWRSLSQTQTKADSPGGTSPILAAASHFCSSTANPEFLSQSRFAQAPGSLDLLDDPSLEHSDIFLNVSLVVMRYLGNAVSWVRYCMHVRLRVAPWKPETCEQSTQVLLWRVKASWKVHTVGDGRCVPAGSQRVHCCAINCIRDLVSSCCEPCVSGLPGSNLFHTAWVLHDVLVQWVAAPCTSIVRGRNARRIQWNRLLGFRSNATNRMTHPKRIRLIDLDSDATHPCTVA